jgi:mannose-6-phosphate isomerase-like protein (cupin superfamily)
MDALPISSPPKGIFRPMAAYNNRQQFCSIATADKGTNDNNADLVYHQKATDKKHIISMEKVNLAEKFGQIHDHWHPRIVGELNGQHVKIVKIKGEFIWHHHAQEDEMFLVLKGSMQMAFRDRVEDIHAGEMIIVPRGVEHKPIAAEEVELMLFEPATTLNTGNQAESTFTRKNPEHI